MNAFHVCSTLTEDLNCPCIVKASLLIILIAQLESRYVLLPCLLLQDLDLFSHNASQFPIQQLLQIPFLTFLETYPSTLLLSFLRRLRNEVESFWST